MTGPSRCRAGQGRSLSVRDCQAGVSRDDAGVITLAGAVGERGKSVGRAGGRQVQVLPYSVYQAHVGRLVPTGM